MWKGDRGVGERREMGASPGGHRDRKGVKQGMGKGGSVEYIGKNFPLKDPALRTTYASANTPNFLLPKS